MAKPVNPKLRKKIIAEAAMGATKTSIAAKYGISRNTVIKIINSDPEFNEKCAQKKEEMGRTVLEHMDGLQGAACLTLDKLLSALTDKNKIEKASLAQIATAFGILVDKFTAGKQKESGDIEDLSALADMIANGKKSND